MRAPPQMRLKLLQLKRHFDRTRLGIDHAYDLRETNEHNAVVYAIVFRPKLIGSEPRENAHKRSKTHPSNGNADIKR